MAHFPNGQVGLALSAVPGITPHVLLLRDKFGGTVTMAPLRPRRVRGLRNLRHHKAARKTGREAGMGSLILDIFALSLSKRCPCPCSFAPWLACVAPRTHWSPETEVKLVFA